MALLKASLAKVSSFPDEIIKLVHVAYLDVREACLEN